MTSKKSTLIYIMLAIFLISISLGCTNKNTDQQNVTPAPQQNVTPTPQQTTTSSINSSIPTEITLSSLKDGSNVSFNEPISGNSTGVYDKGLHLYVLINPIDSGNKWWVQPEAEVSSDGSWDVNAQFGLSATENVGAQFRVAAVATSDSLLEENTSFPSKVENRTKSVLVTRK